MLTTDRVWPTHLRCSRCGHTEKQQAFKDPEHPTQQQCPQCKERGPFRVLWSTADGLLVNHVVQVRGGGFGRGPDA